MGRWVGGWVSGWVGVNYALISVREVVVCELVEPRISRFGRKDSMGEDDDDKLFQSALLG